MRSPVGACPDGGSKKRPSRGPQTKNVRARTRSANEKACHNSCGSWRPVHPSARPPVLTGEGGSVGVPGRALEKKPIRHRPSATTEGHRSTGTMNPCFGRSPGGPEGLGEWSDRRTLSTMAHPLKGGSPSPVSTSSWRANGTRTSETASHMHWARVHLGSMSFGGDRPNRQTTIPFSAVARRSMISPAVTRSKTFPPSWLPYERGVQSRWPNCVRGLRRASAFATGHPVARDVARAQRLDHPVGVRSAKVRTHFGTAARIPLRCLRESVERPPRRIRLAWLLAIACGRPQSGRHRLQGRPCAYEPPPPTENQNTFFARTPGRSPRKRSFVRPKSAEKQVDFQDHRIRS